MRLSWSMEFDFEDILAYVNRCVQAYVGRPLTDTEQGILRWTFAGLSYASMARKMGYSQKTLRGESGFKLWKLMSQVWPDEGKVTKSKFRRIAERRYRQQRLLQESPNSTLVPVVVDDNPPDRGASVTTVSTHLADVRSQFLHILDTRRYPLVILTGVTGIGKSHLLQTLEPELTQHFQHIILQPFYETPSWRTFYHSLYSLDKLQPNIPTDTSEALSERQLRQKVIQALNQTSHLIVIEKGEQYLDNADCIAFIQEITTAMGPQSCLLWVTAVQPNFPQRISIQVLGGLSFIEAKALLLESHPHLSSSLVQQESDWQRLHKLCGGNPSLLYKSVEALELFYTNQIDRLIADLLPLPRGLTDYFEQGISPLAEAEKALLYWLALCPLSWAEIKTWSLMLPFKQTELMYAWEMLHRRHLLDIYSEADGLYQLNSGYFRLYILQTLQTTFVQELTTESLQLFHQYPILLPHVCLDHQQELKQYLLNPVVEDLHRTFSQKTLQAKFDRLLSQLIDVPDKDRSYAAGNLFNLAAFLQLTLPDMNWSALVLWHADLRVPGLQGTNFQGCQLKDFALATGLQGVTVSALHSGGDGIAIGDEQGWLHVYLLQGNRASLAWCQDLGVPITDINITSSGTLVVTLIEQSIRIWEDFSINQKSDDDLSSDAAICSLTLRSDNNLLAAGLSSGEIYLWNRMWGDTQGEPLSEITDIVNYLTFSPDGRMLAGHNHNNQVWIWHQSPRKDTYKAALAPLPLDPYGHFLACQWTATEQLHVVEAVADHTMACSPNPSFKVIVRSFTLSEAQSPDDSGAPYIQILQRAGHPQRATFSKNGLYLALCDQDNKIWIWHQLSPIPEKTIVLSAPPYSLSISNDGRWLLCQNADTVCLWDLEKQLCLKVWKSVSDLDQYQDCQFSRQQGLSDDEFKIVQRLGAILCK